MPLEREELAALLGPRGRELLLAEARRHPGRVLRLLTGRLYSAEEARKWRAVRALGALAADPETAARIRWPDQLRRWFWSLNDESGAVPHGMPEAIGEVLSRRPDLQPDFLPLLGGLLTHEERFQTGAIERGVVWALGRVGASAAAACPEAAAFLAAAAREHPDPRTRRMARWAAGRVGGRQ
jgi:hypothetical protein